MEYNNSEIFGHKEFYLDFIKELVEEILILTGEESQNKSLIEENNEIKKEKIFEWGKDKRQIILTLNSINIKIKEYADKNIDINENKNRKNTNYFEYYLPLNLLPLFYYKGFEKFKIFLLSIIHFNEETQKFEINENIPKIINILLRNCEDVKFKKKKDDELDNEISNLLQPFESNKTMNNNKLNITSKLDKKQNNQKSLAKTINLGMALLQNQLFAGTNVDIISKKKLKKSKFNLYPKELKNFDFINYSNFNFFWIISDKIFSVNIEMPLFTFGIPSYNIFVKQYIDFELLFYLFKINFNIWDFYAINYLSSFKKFRILLSQCTAIRPKKNINIFLEKYKNRYFESTDSKIINIITSKFLAGKEDNEKHKMGKLFDLKKLKLKKINEKNEEISKEKRNEDKIEENKENLKENNEKRDENLLKEDENINIKKVENKEEKKEKNKKEDNIIQKKKEFIEHISREETGQKILTTNNENNVNNKNKLSSNNINKNINDNRIENNSILEQKCFMIIVTFTDMEKYISNQYTIHFNYSHFTKCKSMEKYMKKASFLLKFINIDYEKSTILFDYESLNAFDEKKWINEIEKYKLNYESEITHENKNIEKEEEKNGEAIISNKNKVQYSGAKKGTTISIEIKPPIILLKSIDKNGNIKRKIIETSEEEENKLTLNEKMNNYYTLTKNIYDISLYHKKKENKDKSNKELSDNILLYAFKKGFSKQK